mgnify:FL=1
MTNWLFSGEVLINLKQRLSTILSGISLALAVAASAWIALLPGYYKGVAETEKAGEAPQELTGLTASFIEMNGLRGVFTLLIPVLIALAGFLVSWHTGRHTTFRRVILWALVALLLVFCAAGGFSIGMFYLPSALALLVAAIFNMRNKLGNNL